LIQVVVLGKPVISKEIMSEGIRMILKNVSRYVRDARLLLKDNSVEHATLLALYAAEELGKASLLYRTQEKGELVVDSALFRGKQAHEKKMNEARRLLGDSVLLQSSIFGRARLPFILGAPEVKATPELRMDCTFVDFREGKWRFGALFVAEHLNRLLLDIDTQTSSIRESL
jgi:AbiV family abortive infection protein